jgi:hypothetical protein
MNVACDLAISQIFSELRRILRKRAEGKQLMALYLTDEPIWVSEAVNHRAQTIFATR